MDSICLTYGVLDWHGDLGDEARAKLAESGLIEAESDDGLVSTATISDRIRDFPALIQLTEIMDKQCQSILNNRLRLEEAFTSQICGSISETLQMILLSALYNRCPLLDTEGYACIASRQPVIYIPDSFAFETSLFRACSYLLLPSSKSVRVIRSVSTKRHDGDVFLASSLDCDALIQAVEEDKQAGRMPLCTFAALPTTVYRGNGLVYKNDNLDRIRQICDAQGMWLHITGADLVFQSANHRPAAIATAIDTADSFTIRPRDLIATGSDSHILTIRSTQFKERLRKGPVYDIVAPVYMLLSSIASRLQIYADAHLSAVRNLIECSRTHYSDYFTLETSQHSEIRPTFYVIPTCVELDQLGLTLQMANNFILEGIAIKNLNCAVVFDSQFDGLILTIRPFKYDQETEGFCTKENVAEFLGIIKSQVKRLARGVRVRESLGQIFAEKTPFVWSDKSNFSCNIGLGAFRLVPGFLTQEQHEAANCLNDCLAEQLYQQSPCFRGCFSDDNLVSIAILTIPNDCLEEMSDREIAEHVFDIIFKTQAQIQYPQAVIELLSKSLRTGIEEAEEYLTEMQSRNFSPLEIIRSVPIIGPVLGWLFNQDDPDAKNPATTFGQSFDLESKSLSRRATRHDILLK